MDECNVPAQSWFYAKVRWAVMVEGRGIREWKEAGILFRSQDLNTAFRRELEIGEGYQGGAEEGTRRPRWIETRLAEVVTLDCQGEELKDEKRRCTGHTSQRGRRFPLTISSDRQPRAATSVTETKNICASGQNQGTGGQIRPSKLAK